MEKYSLEETIRKGYKPIVNLLKEASVRQRGKEASSSFSLINPKKGDMV